MKSLPTVIAVLAALLPLSVARAQPEDDAPPRATEIPTEGFWPTQTMLDRILDRISDDMADHYDFDDEQHDLTRELFEQTIPTWLRENRAEIQTLTNEFFEAQLHDEPPTIDGVATWSKRVLRMFDDFDRNVMTDLTDGMREYMTDDQQLQLDAEYAAYETALGMVNNKLSIWADGGYDPESEWFPPGRERRELERAEERARREAMDRARAEVLGTAEDGAEAGDAAQSAAATSQPARVPDAWRDYTEAFIARYDLDDAQQQKARSFLRSAQESRDRYLRPRKASIDKVQARLAAADDEVTRQRALAEFDKLNAPIERRFQQLKDKLNTLPTRAQRKAVAAAELEAAEPTGGDE